MRLLPSAATAVALALLAPAAAPAQTCVAPPGTSGVDQYCETIPSDRGERPSAPGSVAPAPLSPSDSRAVQQELNRSGRDGAALAQVTGIGKASDAARKRRGSKGGPSVPGGRGAGDQPASDHAPSNDPFNAVGSVVSSGTGMSGGFVTVLLLMALVIVGGGFIAARTRKRSSD